MRHVVVTRVTFGLAVLFTAAAGLFALVAVSRPAPLARETPTGARGSVEAPAGAGEGAALFGQRCGGCHQADALSRNVQGRRETVAAFLQTHGEAAPEEDRLILDYLTTRED